MELAYREEPTYGGKFLVVQPYGSEEGTGYGEGDGTFTGPRLQGKARWVNHPHRRSDGMMLPDAHGVIAGRTRIRVKIYHKAICYIWDL